MNRKLLQFVLLLPVVASCGFDVSAQGKVQYYMLAETSLGEARDSYGKWRPEVPYKNPVRLISEPFEFPDGYDAGREEDVKIQFLEYVMKTNPDAIKKLELHSPQHGKKSYPVPESSSSQSRGYPNARQSDYVEQLNVAKNGSVTYDIILVKGFKYEVDKYIGPSRFQKAKVWLEVFKRIYAPRYYEHFPK